MQILYLSIRNNIVLTSVSYTHLDVYKRQAYSRTLFNRRKMVRVVSPGNGSYFCLLETEIQFCIQWNQWLHTLTILIFCRFWYGLRWDQHRRHYLQYQSTTFVLFLRVCHLFCITQHHCYFPNTIFSVELVCLIKPSLVKPNFAIYSCLWRRAISIFLTKFTPAELFPIIYSYACSI